MYMMNNAPANQPMPPPMAAQLMAAPPQPMAAPAANRPIARAKRRMVQNESSEATNSTNGTEGESRPKKVTKWQQPLPDSVEIENRLQGKCTVSTTVAVQPACLCGPQVMMGGACRCNPLTQPPIVRMPGAGRHFELLDMKWLMQVQDIRPSSCLDPSLCLVVAFQLTPPLSAGCELLCDASITVINRSVHGAQHRHTFHMGKVSLSNGRIGSLPIKKDRLGEVIEQPVNTLTPNFATFDLDFELKVDIVEHNIKQPLKFTYNFGERTDLSDWVLICQGREFYVDCSYLRYYSAYFEGIRHQSDSGLFSTHASGLSMIDYGEDIDPVVMEDILLHVSPSRRPLTISLLFDTVAVADRLLFVTVKEEAERIFIYRRQEFNELELLQASFTYNLERLQDFVLDVILRQRSSHPAVSLFSSLSHPQYDCLSSEVKVAILDRLQRCQVTHPPPQVTYNGPVYVNQLNQRQ